MESTLSQLSRMVASDPANIETLNNLFRVYERQNRVSDFFEDYPTSTLTEQKLYEGDERAEEALNKVDSQTDKRMKALTLNAKDRYHKDFVKRGGCKTCNGTGTILTWFTLDGPSWNEYGPCDNGECTASTVGKDLSAVKDYGYKIKAYFTEKEQEEFSKLYQLDMEISDMLFHLRDLRLVGLKKTVIVTKGRKVPKGTVGLLFWCGGAYNKVGIVDKEGVKHWTYLQNIEVTLKPEHQVTNKRKETHKDVSEGIDTQSMFDLIKHKLESISTWETSFYESTKQQFSAKGKLSYKQLEILKRIYNKASQS